MGLTPSPGQFSDRLSATRGVTMLELLIVMTIMLMVTVATIPVIMPALTNRRMRESSRLVSGFFSGARARAIETGRPFGVMLERSSSLPFAMTLSYVEVPPPYSGDTLNSRVTLGAIGEITVFFTGDTLWMNNIRFGDHVQLDYKGPTYMLAPARRSPCSDTSPDPRAGESINALPVAPNHWFLLIPATTFETFTDNNGNGKYDREPFTDNNNNGTWDGGEPFTDTDSNGSWTDEPFTDSNGNGVRDVPGAYVFPPAAAWGYAPGANLPFQIIRQPVRSSAAPLQLPEGAVVDLVNSGMTTSGTFGAALAFNPIITFAPNGGVDQVTDGPAGQFRRPTGPMFLLVGRRELMPDIKPTDHNLFDPTPASQHLSNFWVAIAPQSGQVSVSENAQNQGPSGPNCLAKARAFAAGGQGTGGR